MKSGSHSAREVEHRFTRLEMTSSTHEGRIGTLERTVQALIYGLAALATSKSGDMVELLIAVAKP